MKTVLIVGATRGLGASLAHQYASSNDIKVFGTAREVKDAVHPSITWLTDIDLSTDSAAPAIVNQLPKGTHLDLVIVTAGIFHKESFDEPKFQSELAMYTISSISPVFVTQHLVKGGFLGKGSKLIFVSSEAGSIALRHESEGGGMYAHHASKAALNMVGRLLSFDLKDMGIAVGMVHPGFMRTEMTKGVGFDKFWDAGGAVTPDVAAESLRKWIEGFGIEKTGEFWAPRGPGDIGTAEQTIGNKDSLSTPLRLPW